MLLEPCERESRSILCKFPFRNQFGSYVIAFVNTFYHKTGRKSFYRRKRLVFSRTAAQTSPYFDLSYKLFQKTFFAVYAKLAFTKVMLTRVTVVLESALFFFWDFLKRFLKSSPLRFFLSYFWRKLNLELLMALLFLKFCLAIRTLYFFNKPLICPLHFAIKLYLSLFAIRLSKFCNNTCHTLYQRQA